MLTICRFCTCEFAYLIKSITPKISHCGTFVVICIHMHAKSNKKIWVILCTNSQMKLNKMTLLSSFIILKQVSFVVYLVLCFVLFCFCWWFHCWSSPKHSAEVLPSVLKYKEAVVSLPKKMCVLDKLCSGMSYSVIGHEFNISQSTIYIK